MERLKPLEDATELRGLRVVGIVGDGEGSGGALGDVSDDDGIDVEIAAVVTESLPEDERDLKDVDNVLVDFNSFDTFSSLVATGGDDLPMDEVNNDTGGEGANDDVKDDSDFKEKAFEDA